MNHEVVSDRKTLNDESMEVDAQDGTQQQVSDVKEKKKDSPPKIVRNIEHITDEEMRRTSEEQWPPVNGSCDANGCCSQKTDHHPPSLTIESSNAIQNDESNVNQGSLLSESGECVSTIYDGLLDVSANELASYLEEGLYLPKPMSSAAEMMYT